MAIRLPPLKIDYLKSFTDDTGLFQHAKYCIPKRTEGYTTDDNARALIAAVKYHRLKNDPEMTRLSSIYLAFLNHMQRPDGNFHNYLGYERSYLDVDGSPECIGRALWGCGTAINSNLPMDMRLVAKDIFDRSFPWVWKSTSLRFYAFALLGLFEYYLAAPHDDLRAEAEKIGDSLMKQYRNEASNDWQWFEPFLTYDNSRLTHALYVAALLTQKEKFLGVAVESMNFLLRTQMIDGVYMPVGNDGWYKRGEKRAMYDQQPLEAAAMVEAAVDAHYTTGEGRYIEVAEKAFGWYLGRNSRGVMLYNPQTGGCYDGLSVDAVNKNQGGESSISYLLARLKLEELQRGVWKQKMPALKGG
jgi:hypothetical protein